MTGLDSLIDARSLDKLLQAVSEGRWDDAYDLGADADDELEALRAKVTHPQKLEIASLRLAEFAEGVNENVMGNGLAARRDALRYEILAVRALVHDLRAERRAG